MSKLFETIHLGQKILHFNVPIEIVDEINLTYQNNVKDLKAHPLNEKLYPFKEHKNTIEVLSEKLYNEFKATKIPKNIFK